MRPFQIPDRPTLSVVMPVYNEDRTLRAMAKVRAFTGLLMKKVSPFIGRRALEAGCGIGNLTEFLLREERPVAVDNGQKYVGLISDRLGHLANFRSFQMDMSDKAAYAPIKAEKLDTVICMNVLEHVQDDVGVLHSFYETLVPGGHVICLVPRYRWLFGATDEAVGHVRRYSKTDLVEKMRSVDFEIAETLA